MESRSLNFIAAACGGELLSGSAEIRANRVGTDSRQAQAGDVFVALSGDKFDGHDFIAQAAEKHIAAVVVERAKAPRTALPCGVIAVENTRRSLGQLAASYRNQFTLPVIAVAGSNGKTTTKELLASILREKFNTVHSEASFNNDIGVPLTLLKLERSTQAAVLEAGTNHPGELAPLLRMIAPQFGILTSIGHEHLEFFGDLAGVAEEEGWLAELLPPTGKLFLNGDSDWSPRIAARARATVARIGLGADNDWRVQDIRLSKDGAVFRVEAPVAEFNGEFRIQLLGRHQAVNALFGIAVGAELGLSADEVRRGLANCRGAKMRLQLSDLGGVLVLDDSYNANADSMLAALHTLRDLPGSGRRIAVLGDLAELGAQTTAAHLEVGRRAAQLGIQCLITVGVPARQTASAARAAGLTLVRECADVTEASAELQDLVKTGDMVLVKASRAAGLERVIEALRGAQ
jgi:UDP-N-acetylmuramoyl-tripeptide--D-alanyl-D-alanine ligase